MNEAAQKPFLTLRDVAAALGWSPRTIRRHTIDLAEWDPESGKIPTMKIGARAYVPRWWLDATFAKRTGDG